MNQCRDCLEPLELTETQVNYQRLVKGRRDFALCTSCSEADNKAKWAANAIMEQDHQVILKRRRRNCQLAMAKQNDVAKRVRRTLSKK